MWFFFFFWVFITKDSVIPLWEIYSKDIIFHLGKSYAHKDKIAQISEKLTKIGERWNQPFYCHKAIEIMTVRLCLDQVRWKSLWKEWSSGYIRVLGGQVIFFCSCHHFSITRFITFRTKQNILIIRIKMVLFPYREELMTIKYCLYLPVVWNSSSC